MQQHSSCGSLPSQLVFRDIQTYATPPPEPRFGSVYTVNATGNNHFWVLILIHGLRLPS